MSVSKKQRIDENNSEDFQDNQYEKKEITINDLDNDSLLHIFNFISIKDRIQIQTACKRWKMTADMSWRSIKNINLSSELWGCKPFDNNFTVKKGNLHILHTILKYCGFYLKSIDLNFDDEFESSKELNMFSIGELCPYLEKINIFATSNVLVYQVGEISKYCHNITELKLKNKTLELQIDGIMDHQNHIVLIMPAHQHTRASIEDNLKILLVNNKKLKVLILNNLSCIAEKCFLDIPVINSVEYIDIKGLSVENPEINFVSSFPNLKSLELRMHNYNSDKLIIDLQKNCKELTSLNLSTRDSFCECKLSEFFSKSKLKKLKIQNSNMNGTCLQYLPDSIETIILKKCKRITLSHLINCLKRLSKLHVLKLNQSVHIDDEFTKMLAIYKNVENIMITTPMASRIQDISCIPRVKNLKFLHLFKCIDVNDNYLRLLKLCLEQLLHLQITCCKGITDRGIAEICQLPKLEYLNLRGLRLTGDGLKHIPNLKSLECECLYLRNDESIKAIIKNSLNIEYLKIMSVINITDSIISTANEVTKVRENKKMLTIDICEYSLKNINIKNIVIDSPNLNVVAMKPLKSGLYNFFDWH